MPIKGNITIARLAQFWMEEVRPPIPQALELTPDDKLDWAPGEKMIPLSNIFKHIGEASAWWIYVVIDGKEFEEFAKGRMMSKDELKTVLDEHWKRLEEFFNRGPETFEKQYDMSKFGRDSKVTGEWIFLHLLEHDIHHRSQINHYLRILGIKPPRI